ncbi:sn-glycerol-3-phosphate ABC transporter ATP-binding protein UgpC [Aminobacter carboxidus]|uniref:Sn-glycerol-3-phosphate ABC transporter ATP-binding protein UgpC n=1 Tax=Aminobacter carboxidus TaxID=376165 RepID=A0ABR9GGL2_9HYPH|nr:sn-glycerol-3-phosphate ABC transporter ATP-binding protein UgpC [Aminobacter carboxidus]
MAGVTIENVRKSYGAVEVLRGVDVQVENSEFVALVGPSGCGKSTLLRMIAGLEGISSGEIGIGGRVVNNVPPKQRDVAMVFQSYALYPHMTVAKNMGFSLKLAGLPADEIAQRVSRAAEILDLRPLLDRLPKQLSGGQRQRVAMGRAIVRDPQVFLFDEPLSNLDAKLRVSMRAEIKALHQRLKTTTVYVTHDQVEAMTMADKIVVMRDGLVEQQGSPLELYDRPRNMFVAGFIGSPSMNFIGGTIKKRRFVSGNGLLGHDTDISPMAGDGAVILGVRPEHLSIDTSGIEATVLVVEQTGSETTVLLDAGGTRMTLLARERLTTVPGETVRIAPDYSRLHFFDPASGLRLGGDSDVDEPGPSDTKGNTSMAPARRTSLKNGRTGPRKKLSQALEAIGIRQDRYRPELYYMRGPGPKTHAKSVGADSP